MRRIGGLFFVAVSVMLCSVVAFAQGPDEKNQPAVEEKVQEKQMEKERMAGMAMQMMGAMQKQMVATNEGGVIVLAGSKLLKYDKDLNLVKEVELKTGVELKMDAGSMQEIFKSMKEKYGKQSKKIEGEAQDTEKK